MRALTCYQTLDGSIFHTEYDASRHAEERYGELLVALARELCSVEKFSDAVTWLEENAERLAELARRRTDRAPPCGEEGDE
jgi:hypothetical protein